MEKQNLSSLIWSTADDLLRGLFKPSEYGRIILPFVVLRRLDCVLEPQKDKAFQLYKQYEKKLSDFSQVIQSQLDLPFFNISKFDLLRIKSDPNNVYKNFNNYIQGFSKNVLDIIENFQIDPLVTKLNKNKKLYLLIDKFTEFDLHPSKIDNHMMGTIYEELLRKFSEMSNEESGDHFTPRDIVKLVVSLVFSGDKENLSGNDKIRSIYDSCCGTGGMLTIGKNWVKENINKDLKIELFGQELNDVTYAICKSDFLMSNEDPENIKGPISTLSDDKFSNRKFDYLITNPPFGVSWKTDQEFVKNELKDSSGRFSGGAPRISDGSLLFLQNLIHKMDSKKSRIGIIFNASPLNVGDAGSGEAEIRKWVIEKDLLETVIMLPDKLFFNTGITTYIWILDNKKTKERKNKIQLINAKEYYKFIQSKLGEKNKEITDTQINEITKTYLSFKNSEISKIYNLEYFRYTKITIDEYLYDNGKKVKNKNGTYKINSKKRDIEKVPSEIDIQEFIKKEVSPYRKEFLYDPANNQNGYELSLTKEFYNYDEVKKIDQIRLELNQITGEISKLEKNL